MSVAIPSRPDQIKAVMGFLDADEIEGQGLQDIAAHIVDGYHDMLYRGIKSPMQPIRPGMLFKAPILGAKPYRVAWMNETHFWFVSDGSGFGSFAPLQGALWQHSEEFRPKRKVDKKMVEMSDEDISEAWSNPAWQVGDKVSMFQRTASFEIIATGPQCVLLAGQGRMYADSNTNLERYYQRESEAKEAKW